MCVIAIVRDKRPTDKMIEDMADTNGDGMGFAYRKGGLVHWEKGLEDVAYVQEMAKKLPLPYILHFRIASIGKICSELTHPFPVEKDAPLWEKGTTGGAVLFHNGSWSRWQDLSLEMAIHHPGCDVPDGEWSDTRAMAWVTAWKGKNALKLIGEKCVLFSPTEIDIYRKDWENVNGVFCSNKHFEYGHRSRYSNGQWVSTMCKFMHCTEKANLDKDGRCPQHPMIPPQMQQVLDRATAMSAANAANEEGKLPVLDALPGGAASVDPFAQAFTEKIAPVKALRERGKLSRREYRAAKKRIRTQMEQELLNDTPPVLLKSSQHLQKLTVN